MDKNFNSESELDYITHIAVQLQKIGHELMSKPKASLYAMRVGNLLQLMSGIIITEADATEADKFLTYFSAKKVIDTVTPNSLYFAKRISETPGMREFIESMFADDDGLDGNCDNCPARDTCTDRHCEKPDSPSDEEPKPPKKPRKPRNPKK